MEFRRCWIIYKVGVHHYILRWFLTGKPDGCVLLYSLGNCAKPTPREQVSHLHIVNRVGNLYCGLGAVDDVDDVVHRDWHTAGAQSPVWQGALIVLQELDSGPNA